MLGGTDAITSAYRQWVLDLRPLLLTAQNKKGVLASPAGCESIALATVRATCAGIFGLSAASDATVNNTTAHIYSLTKDGSVRFARRRGKHESFVWTAEGIRRYPPLVTT